jgi:hypothetical protein
MTDHLALPAAQTATLEALTEAATAHLGDDLIALVLYGSAAEGRLRATSDVNLLFVLARFDRARVDPLRETLRTAQAVARVSAMFVLADELPAATEAFATKFADIAHRHVVLHGDDPFAGLVISRAARVAQLRQSLLNLALRQRERYALTSLREEALARVLADMAGPLRVAAATLLDLRGTPADSPKAALETLAPSLGVAEWADTLAHISTARETGLLPPGAAADTCFRLMAMTEALRRLADEV